MKSVFSINLIFLVALMSVSNLAFAQPAGAIDEEFPVCSSRTPDDLLVCGFGDTTIEEAGEDFCLNRYGIVGPRDGLLSNAAHGLYQCTTAGIELGISFAECRWFGNRAGTATCRSIPPVTPLETHDYKLLDGIRSNNNLTCVHCGCEGEQWTHIGASNLIGCLAPKPVKDKPCLDQPDRGSSSESDTTVGNPCNPSNGNKYATEVDFSNNGLSFVRYYNSGNVSNFGLGIGWTSNHHQRLVMSDAGDELMRVASDGSGEPWRGSSSGAWEGDADSNILLEQTGAGFQVTLSNNDVENYGLSGLLLSKIDSNGLVTSYEYNDDQKLERITNHYGQSISFTYDDGDYIETVTDSNDAVYTYVYGGLSSGLNKVLGAVVYPDTTQDNFDDNPRRQYRYRGSYVGPSRILFLNLLTEIVDENGDRYGIYTYDAEGRVTQTTHASTTNFRIGQERFRLEYQD